MEPNDLFDVPPAEFVKARNALAKELKAAGKADAARTVAAMRRPSPVVYALNHVARHEDEVIAAFLLATDALRAAQHGTPERMRAAMQAHREALARLGAAGAKALGAHGPALERRITDSAQGAALSDRDRLREGTLLEEYAPPGFAALGGVHEQAARTRAQAEEQREKVHERVAATHAAVRHVREKAHAARDAKARQVEEQRRRMEERKQQLLAKRERDRALRELHAAERDHAMLTKRAESAARTAETARQAAEKSAAAARAAQQKAEDAGARVAALRAAVLGR